MTCLGVLAGLLYATSFLFEFATSSLRLLRSWYMGSDALSTSGITSKILFLLREHRFIDPKDPLVRVRKSRIALFIGLELVGFGATMAITQTIGEDSGKLLPQSLLLKPELYSGDWIPRDHHALDTTPNICHPTSAIHD